MNLKLRFALLFTFFVTVILFVFSITIYFLFYNYRESDYFERVKNEGLELYEAYSKSKQLKDNNASVIINILHNSTIFDQRVVVLDPDGKIVNKIPESIHPVIDPQIIQHIKSEKQYVWYSENNYQNAGLVLNASGQILISTGYDKNGFDKIYKLRLIIIIVLIGGLLITAFTSFFFVREAFKPLTNLGLQMKQTDLQNLGKRLKVSENNGEINEIARNFNGMLERLEKAFIVQKNFVNHASHELRTPLATMLSQTESALGREMTVPEYKKLLLSLKEEQQELIELTNSLLLISQFSENEQGKEWPMLRIDEVLYETVSNSKRRLPELSVQISFNPMPENDSDFIIHGNETLLKSAFFNLVKNAFLYSVDHKVQITVESQGTGILVHFDNKGMQLPSDEKENIMEPFFRGSNALRTKGYGLGLSIVHRFITIHNGSVTYTPISNDINRFTVAFEKAPFTAG